MNQRFQTKPILKKSVILFLFLLFMRLHGFSQIASNYNFTAVSGTFSSISATGTRFSFADNDDAFSSVLPIGFSFPLNGTNYSSCYLNTNGYLTFNSTPATNTANMRGATLGAYISTLLQVSHFNLSYTSQMVR